MRGYSSLPDNYPNQSFDSKIKVANIIYSHIELQSTILKKKDYGKIEFGLDGVLFVNAGLGSQNLDEFNLDQIISIKKISFLFFAKRIRFKGLIIFKIFHINCYL